MTVLVTRGLPGAEHTATALRSIGIDPIISPVLDINFRAKIDVNLDGVQALAFSSANGVRAWGLRRDERDYPVFAVASTTADSARDICFRRVHSADGDVVSLVRLLKRKLEPENGTILHVRGTHIAGDLAGELKPAGYTVRETIGYEAVAVDRLSDDAIKAIESGAPVSVLIHSARGAKAFLELLRKFDLMQWLASVTAYGMSENALKPLQGAGFSALHAASTPDEKSLLALLSDTEQLAPTGNAF